MYTLGQAARAVGRSKTTLGRYIKSGRLSATRAEDGAYIIDPAELHRVFHVARNGHGYMERSVTLDGPEPAPSPETLALRQLLAERERLVEEQKDVAAALSIAVSDRGAVFWTGESLLPKTASAKTRRSSPRERPVMRRRPHSRLATKLKLTPQLSASSACVMHIRLRRSRKSSGDICTATPLLVHFQPAEIAVSTFACTTQPVTKVDELFQPECELPHTPRTNP
jgi:hypothetical protein